MSHNDLDNGSGHPDRDLVARDLVMTYAKGRSGGQSGPPALGGVDLTIGAGRSLAVMGPSGSGKTTLLHGREQYRALALAGTSERSLHRARALEAALPLTTTIALSAGFVLVLMLPFQSRMDGGLVVRFVVTSAVAGAVVLASVLASRSLVRTASRVA